MRRIAILGVSVALLAWCIAEAQWIDTQLEENAPVYGPLLPADDDDSAAPEPTPEPTPEPKKPLPEPVRAEQVQQQVEVMVESASALEVLDVYLVDKAAVESSTCPEGFELPPLEYYKSNEIREPLTKVGMHKDIEAEAEQKE